jgi:hypothetical protein
MKGPRRIRKFAVVMLLLLAAAAGVGYMLVYRQPDWYQQLTQSEQTASGIDGKLAIAQAWAADVQAARQGRSPLPSGAGVLELSVTEAQINAAIARWKPPAANSAGGIADPEILLEDGQVVLAGKPKNLGLVVSVRLAPWLDGAGDLHVDIVKVHAGLLPLPRPVWGIYAGGFAAAVAAQLPGEDQLAKRDSDGSVNDAMTAAVLSRMLIRFLNCDSARPILFVTYFPDNRVRNLPVKLELIRIANKTATIRLTPLGRGEPIEDPPQSSRPQSAPRRPAVTVEPS